MYKALRIGSDSQTLLANMDWRKRATIVFFGAFHSTGISTNRLSWMQFRTSLGIGDLDNIGIGWKFIRAGNHLYTQSHDGHSLEENLLGVIGSVNDDTHRFRCEYYPGDRVDFYKDDTLVQSHTTIPPSAVIGNGSIVAIGANNLSANSYTKVSLNRFLLVKDW
jgi:hypothetical protein